MIYELRGNPDSQIQLTIAEVTSGLDKLDIHDEFALIDSFADKMRAMETTT